MSHSLEQVYKQLLDKQIYPHPCDQVKLVETHISKVYLTGDYAYKIKKPVDFGFLDFSKLDDRKHYCEEEIRLNSRLAEAIYLEVVAIALDTQGKINLKGKGDIVEYAVKMKQFDVAQQLDQLQKNKKLPLSLANQLANLIARFHQNIAIAPSQSDFGKAEQVLQPMMQNFEQIAPFLLQQQDIQQLKQLELWTQKTFTRIEPLLVERKQKGFIRECHGDMHLGNMTLYQDKVQIFDGIEFNDDFRWIDTASEIAFFYMDLEFLGARQFANQFLDHYLSQTGDYAMLAIFRFYKVYRALVRAKIAQFTAAQMDKNSDDWCQQQEIYQQYIKLASSYTQSLSPQLIITHGVSGSGKSWVSQKVVTECGFIRIRSDIERKRLFSQQEKEQLYSRETTEKVYQHLLELSKMLLISGYDAIVDATFLQQKQRQLFINLAQSLSVNFTLLSIESDPKTIEQRLQKRQQGFDISDADLSIMQQQLKQQDNISDTEQQYQQVLYNNDDKYLLSQIKSLFCKK